MALGNWTEYNAEDHVQLLRYWVQLAVDAFTGLRSIRVQDIEVRSHPPPSLAVYYAYYAVFWLAA